MLCDTQLVSARFCNIKMGSFCQTLALPNVSSLLLSQVLASTPFVWYLKEAFCGTFVSFTSSNLSKQLYVTS